MTLAAFCYIRKLIISSDHIAMHIWQQGHVACHYVFWYSRVVEISVWANNEELIRDGDFSPLLARTRPIRNGFWPATNKNALGVRALFYESSPTPPSLKSRKRPLRSYSCVGHMLAILITSESTTSIPQSCQPKTPR